MTLHRFIQALPASKSILNRLLLICSYLDGQYEIRGDSDCADVRSMRAGLSALSKGGDLPCGEGAAVFRFLAFRAARRPGRHLLRGSPRLLSRPMKPLIGLLEGLGVSARLVEGEGLLLEGDGWKDPGRPLQVDLTRSSQFASALLLNAWELPFPLRLDLSKKALSLAYLDLTRTLCEEGGMCFQDGPLLVVPPGQSVMKREWRAGPDQGAAFALAAVALFTEDALLPPADPLQPDGRYPQVLRAMGVPLREVDGGVVVPRWGPLKPLELDLKEMPDLFPVLSVLCAMADGKSRLYGAPHLAWKESDRIAGCARLVRAMGREFRQLEDGLEVEGSLQAPPVESIPFATDQDHRLAFAAALAMKAGFPIIPDHPQVVDKSFPGFWEVIGGIS